MTTEKESSVLDQIKQIEKRNRARLLVKTLNKLKLLAKEVLEAKEETTARLEQLHLPEKDQKAVIDWINSLTDVQLTDDDKKRIGDKVKKDLEEKKKEVEKEAEKTFYYEPSHAPANTAQWTSATNSVLCSTNASGLTVSSGTSALNIAL